MIILAIVFGYLFGGCLGICFAVVFIAASLLGDAMKRSGQGKALTKYKKGKPSD